MRGFPGGLVVKNLPSNAGDPSSIPGRGTKIPHATGQLSPHATTIELTRLNERARMSQTTEPTCSGACVPQLEKEKLHATTGEKPTCCNKRSRVPQRRYPMLQLRPDAAKINKYFLKYLNEWWYTDKADWSRFDDWLESASEILSFLTWEIERIVLLVSGIVNPEGKVV